MKWSWLTRLLGGRSTVQLIAIGFALSGLVGAIDYLTGFELSLSIFYLIPVALVSWYGPRWAGFLLCGISALIWLVADSAAGHPYSRWIMPIENAAVRLGFFLVTTQLLGTLRARLRHEEILARTDGLTQVLNARAFTGVSERLLRLAERHQHPVALAYIDVDNFKAVNDTQGHSAGDLVLMTIAGTITRCIRSTDVVGRMGGDEFAVLMPETGYAGAHTAVAKVHEELVRESAAHNWPIGFSIGVAVFSAVPPTVDGALRAADGLMYRVKQAGKNNVLLEECAAVAEETGSKTLPYSQ